MLVKNLKQGGFGFCPRMGPSVSLATCKSASVASNGSKEAENKTKYQEVGYQVATSKGRKSSMKKRAKKRLNKNFLLSTKVLENRGEQVSKTNKPINKQAVHLD
jgi:hypothetical protein